MHTLTPIVLIGKFWQDDQLSQLFRFTVLIIIIQVVLILINYQNLPQLIPFYFSLPWGESWLAPVDYIFILPSISFGILLINNFLSAFLLSKVRLFSVLLSSVSLVGSIFVLYSIIQIILLVI